MLQTSELRGDEARYVIYGQNLAAGYYAEATNPALWCGPGYPLVLAPFFALSVPLIFAKLLNAFFIFFALAYFCKAFLLLNLGRKTALIATYVLGCYPPIAKWTHLLYTEPLAFMLICIFLCYAIKILSSTHPSRTDWLFGALALGYLALTKVIFGHVIVVSLVFSLAWLVWSRKKMARRSSLLLAGGFVFFTPFLVYTYFLTGKYFYSGTQGGELLYFRSSPYDEEYGDWLNKAYIFDDLDQRPKGTYCDLPILRKNHQPFYNQIKDLSWVQKDSIFKKKAIEQMGHYPIKYLKNTVANICRIFFNYPYSYRKHTLAVYGHMLPNMFILNALLLTMVAWIRSRRMLPISLLAPLIFISIYLGGIILTHGSARNFNVIVPFIFCFIGFICTKIIYVGFRK